MRNGIFFTVCITAVFVLTTLSVYGLDITVDTTWDTDQTFSESVNVFPGVTLTINPGVTVSFYGGGNYEINAFSGSTLNINGTESQPITITSAEANPQSGDWGGFCLFSGVNGTVDYVISEYGRNGIWSEADDIDITNSIFRYNLDGVEIKSSPYISGCYFHDNTDRGICLRAGSSAIVSNTVVENNNRGVVIRTDAGLPNLGIHNDPDSPGNNTFNNNTSWDVYNDLSTQVKAEWSNWNDGGAAKIYGNVDIDPRQDEAAVEDASLGEVKATFK